MVKIGLEIHGYLVANEKLFCKCKAEHGLKNSKPNMNICPVCTGQPGAKPLLPNKEAINKVIQIALILGCKINNELVFQRKHYSWPDLPKGYQITISGPHAKPVGEHGKFLGIGITEAHLEEDPAAWNPKTGEIDYNRSGFPLVEIVTEPDFTSSEQVVDWLKQLIATLGYIKAIDKKMGIKSDVNVSVEGGARIEVKNVNSINNIKNTIEHEIERQTKNLPKVQETRRYDETKGITTLMRTKEQAQDYRFITEPDLPVINLSNKLINELKNSLPETPQEKLEKLIKKYKIEKKYAEVLTKKIEIVEFFEKIIPEVEAKLATRWVTEELLSVLNYNKIELDEIELNSKHFIELLKLIENKTITELKAKDILRSWKEKSESPNIKEISNISNDEIQIFAKKVINENEKAVSDYKNGEAKAINFLIGQVMKLSNKRADFNTARITLEKLLK
ncbi:MAG: Aspartyl/glutamyl-tRNA(Asn/Gln) amidotransferase subunit B [archaeon GW2011_AR13]|nr:MAG: Aspartyl/glutamyl-tRNA(Asn/Gln) amidotransferase subunit B [archaeon GW2011_AR13]HIG95078.1 Asp-tRNA(Asn)/Glu-tRNA(Gln) amidotransferase subunit GatB [Nanoarchaeota archaeon]HIH63267.1 Asp-tRNA(Asn)/Glu-tRNA(Gln) amidotransferase subunit GatB [Nanoarchaeota archaeon]HIJ09263.1 Asp-tRNA(Asn)/Glu-tRNA(Gln) amidotransferase subunit GatB [Nanoarchaeota archaeon]